MPDLLLEIGTEELPSSAVYDVLAQIDSLVPALFEKARLSYEEYWTYATPRRLAVTVRGVADRASAQVTRKKGPPLSAARSEGGWTQAALGFARTQGIEADELRVEDTDRGEYVFAVTETEGEEAEELLPGLLLRLVVSLRFKKSMRWGSREERFSRPVRWLAALFRDSVLEFEYAGLESSDVTYGHRYLGKGPVRISTPSAYERTLREAFVVADHRVRLEDIIRGCERVCAAAGAVPLLDDAVLEEVAQLVEWPGVLLGKFDERYLRLPREVLVHAMESHQRYFPVESSSGELEAAFVAVHNGDPAMEDTIRRGHERVLAARLADAEFFFDEDLKVPLAARLADLEHVVYQSELGSMAEKSSRLARLVRKECERLGADEDMSRAVERAATLAKCDLVTHMVTEFPDLQGTVGAIYAAENGEGKRVSRAIGEQYMPRRLGDSLPGTTEGALLSIAEKVDNLAASFGLGHVPTGSEDPYALRRQALGVAMITIDHGFAFGVPPLVRESASLLEAEARGFRWTDEAEGAFCDFFTARMRGFFTERGYRYDLVEAVLALDWGVPLLAQRRLDALARSRETGQLNALHKSFDRCHNLSKGQRAGRSDDGLLVEPAERALLSAFDEAQAAVDEALSTLDFAGVLDALEVLCEPVDRLFDEVLIMAEDQALRESRLSLLARLDALFGLAADFSRLTGD